MVPRHHQNRLKQLLRTFPIVSILGPRQCGKTCFIRSALPQWRYLDLEKPSDVNLVSQDPEYMLRKLNQHFILDEAHQLPDLFPILRSHVDGNRRKNGQLVLLGSASPNLIKRISESLAGRTGFLDMSPFHWHEIHQHKKETPLSTLWHRGGFPDAFLKSSQDRRLDWFESFSRTFIERDLPALGIEISAPQMRKLMAMLSHANGGVWNASQIAASLGVNYHTINRYVDILEQTFFIRKLPPYFANVGKRLVKSPKLYFRDTGLLHYFLGVNSPKILETHPMRGSSWEGFIIHQVIDLLSLFSPSARAFYWRTASGVEVDLMIERDSRLVPFEIKLHSSPSKRDIQNLVICMGDLKITKGYVIYPGKEDYSLGSGVTALSAENLLANPQRLLRL